MSGTLDTTNPDEWFEAKASQYGITATDFIHPADLSPDEAEDLRVLVFTKTDNRHWDYEVERVGEAETPNMGTLTYAYYLPREGIAIGMDRENYTEDGKLVRFVPRDATFQINTKEDAVHALRDLSAHDRIPLTHAKQIASPWGLADEFGDRWDDTMPTYLICRSIVALGIEGESPISAEQYFGMSIGGHQKSERGQYKANLTILEEDAGMEPTYKRFDPVQNPENKRNA